MFSDDLCCDITLAIGEGNVCDSLPGGIEDVRIGCLKYFNSYTEGSCAADPTTAYVTAITAQDPVTAAAVVPLYSVSIKKRTGSHEFVMTFDNDTDTTTIAETLEWEITALGTQARCAILQYIGQEVVVFFKYRGSDIWYMSGWMGGLYVTEINGGSGTDARRRTRIILSGTDLEELFIEFFNTDVATTNTAVDALTN